MNAKCFLIVINEINIRNEFEVVLKSKRFTIPQFSGNKNSI